MARTVLVTGGNRGIGLAIAEAFAKQGDRVAVTHRGSGVVQGMFGVACDVTDPAAVDAAFTSIEAELGPVEVLVANAGITADTLLMRMSEEQFTSVLDTNLTGSWRVARRAATKMVRGRWGRMIFISSVVGLYGAPGQVNYAASKAGLVGLARSITRELGTRNVTANVVAPGFIETDMTASIPFVNRQVARRVNSLQQGGQPGDVAQAISFLVSDGALGVNGEVLRVCGQNIVGQ